MTTPNSGLLEMTATTFLGGVEIMETSEGREQVIAKIAELKPQVGLWYRDEGQFQQQLENGELNAGLYYRDATMLSVWDGLPVASSLPKEGGIVSDAYWVALCDTMDLTDEEFAAVSSEIDPIRVQTHIHLREGGWLETKYQEMIAQ